MKEPAKYAAVAAMVAALVGAAIYANSGSRPTSEAPEAVAATGEAVTSAAEGETAAASTPAAAGTDHATEEQQIATLELPVEPDQQSTADTSVASDPPIPSPLAEYPGFGHNIDRDEAQFELEEQEREDMVADCMSGQGYKYTPAPSIVLRGELGEEDLERLLSEASTDPNDAHVASLSEEQRQAWYMALTGVPDPNAPEAADLPDFESGGGCVGEALRQLPGVYALRQQLQPELDAMEEAIATDSRVAVEEQEWSRCMQTKGYDFGSPSAMHAAVDETAAELSDFASAAEELEAQQLKASQAGQECYLPLSRTIKAVRDEHEQTFVSQYREILEASD